MSSYTIKITKRSKKAKNFLMFLLDYAKDNDFISIDKSPNPVTRKAMKDARDGKVTKVESVKELFDNI